MARYANLMTEYVIDVWLPVTHDNKKSQLIFHGLALTELHLKEVQRDTMVR